MHNTDTTAAHTFLFIDVVAFTSITQRDGDHRAAEIATTLIDVTAAAANSIGVEFVKSIGDAVMLRARTAHEALAVALRVRRDLAAIDDFPAVHAGIHTGPAVPANGDWFGNTVNLASRIADSAGPGEILCSAETLAEAGDAWSTRFTDCGARSFRNSTPKLGVFSAERATPRFVRRPAGVALAAPAA